MNKKILLVYRLNAKTTLRATTAEHLYSFQNYSPYPIDYWNVEESPGLTKKQIDSYDLIIFHYLFLTHHWGGRKHFMKGLKWANLLKETRGIKVALPQDEFIHTDLFCEFINQFHINVVFSVAPESEWSTLYRTVNLNKVHFFQVLTGYIDEKKIQLVETLAKENVTRTIDIGYRVAGKPCFWFGRHGYLKQDIAEHFLEAGKTREQLVLDIRTDNTNVILGDDWYRFLLSCKYTIGVESGTSVHDWDGSIYEQTEDYVVQHPDANFEEVELHCFPEEDGKIALFALGPRHLEACMTRTCQILTQGNYNGILKPNIHYIEINKDFSNVGEILDKISRNDVRQDMVERTYRDIVSSGLYTYRRFVESVIEKSLNLSTLNNCR